MLKVIVSGGTPSNVNTVWGNKTNNIQCSLTTQIVLFKLLEEVNSFTTRFMYK